MKAGSQFVLDAHKAFPPVACRSLAPGSEFHYSVSMGFFQVDFLPVEIASG